MPHKIGADLLDANSELRLTDEVTVCPRQVDLSARGQQPLSSSNITFDPSVVTGAFREAKEDEEEFFFCFFFEK